MIVPTVSAMTQDDINSINDNTAFYQPDQCSSIGNTNTTTAATSIKPVIVLDPGHSGDVISDTDPQTGLKDLDYPNIPEITEVFSVAQKVESQLQTDGYTVVMTKTSVDQDVSLRQRADIAEQANADLAVSIHDSHGTSWNNMGSGDGGQVYTQNVGDYRQNKPNMGRGNQKITFTDSTIAQKSNQFGEIFAQQRTADEHHTVAVTHDTSFNNRSDVASGNIPEVELFANVPWVYNEVGAPSGPLSQSQLNEYAKGIIDGVEKSIPITTPQNTATDSSDSCCDSSSSGSVSADTSGSSSGVWNSATQPPYIIEEYAINILEDLAQKKNVPTTDTVTSQHVLALVTWAFIEGGDIENTDLFNLYNTTLMSSDLHPTMQSTGSPAYATFNDGVEAIARTLASGHGGMLAVLLNPDSTAKDFAHAESYTGTSSYPGTEMWAQAALDDPSGYIENTWDPILSQVETDYKAKASIEIGTSAYENNDPQKYSDPSKLSNLNSGGFIVNTSSNDCTEVNAQGAQAIVQEALKLAWPDGSHGNIPSPAYAAALAQYNPTNYTREVGNDCGVFVSTVMRASGVDPNYPVSGTSTQSSYAIAHTDKYNVAYNVTSLNDLEPGDIIILGAPNGAYHTWIFVGKQTGSIYYSASASEGTRTGNLDTDQLASPNIRIRLK